MNVWKNKLVPILFALGGLLFLVPVVKQAIKGEPVNPVSIACFVLAIVLLVLAAVVEQKWKFPRQFWGGLLIGIGIGLMVGGTVVEHVPLKHRYSILLPSILLGAAGVSLARKASEGT